MRDCASTDCDVVTQVFFGQTVTIVGPSEDDGTYIWWPVTSMTIHRSRGTSPRTSSICRNRDNKPPMPGWLRSIASRPGERVW